MPLKTAQEQNRMPPAANALERFEGLEPARTALEHRARRRGHGQQGRGQPVAPQSRRTAKRAPRRARSRWRLGVAASQRRGVMTAGRDAAIGEFLRAAGWSGVTPLSLAGDASFRRYYRLTDGARRAVLMDAPPPMEDVRPYVAVAAILRRLGLSAPEIYEEDAGNGFLLIEDFGDDTYTRLLERGADEPGLYALAVDTLIAMQQAAAARGIRETPYYYDTERLLAEAALLVDWYRPLAGGLREEYLGLWREVLPRAVVSPPTLVLRDYHVDNLMLLPGRPGVRGCGLLEARGHVHGVAGHERLPAGRVPGDHLTAVEARSGGDPNGPFPLQLEVQADELFPQLHRGPDCSKRMVLQRGWHAEHGHARVSDELLDGPAVSPADR